MKEIKGQSEKNVDKCLRVLATNNLKYLDEKIK